MHAWLYTMDHWVHPAGKYAFNIAIMVCPTIKWTLGIQNYIQKRYYWSSPISHKHSYSLMDKYTDTKKYMEVLLYIIIEGHGLSIELGEEISKDLKQMTQTIKKTQKLCCNPLKNYYHRPMQKCLSNAFPHRKMPQTMLSESVTLENACFKQHLPINQWSNLYQTITEIQLPNGSCPDGNIFHIWFMWNSVTFPPHRPGWDKKCTTWVFA